MNEDDNNNSCNALNNSSISRDQRVSSLLQSRRFSRRDMIRSRSLRNVLAEDVAGNGSGKKSLTPTANPKRTRSLAHRLERSQSLSKICCSLQLQQEEEEQQGQQQAPKIRDTFGDEIYNLDPHLDYSSTNNSECWGDDHSRRDTIDNTETLINKVPQRRTKSLSKKRGELVKNPSRRSVLSIEHLDQSISSGSWNVDLPSNNVQLDEPFEPFITMAPELKTASSSSCQKREGYTRSLSASRRSLQQSNTFDLGQLDHSNNLTLDEDLNLETVKPRRTSSSTRMKKGLVRSSSSRKKGNPDQSSTSNFDWDESLQSLQNSAGTNRSSKPRRTSSSSRRKEVISRNSSRKSRNKNDVGNLDHSSSSALLLDESLNSMPRRTSSSTKRKEGLARGLSRRGNLDISSSSSSNMDESLYYSSPRRTSSSSATRRKDGLIRSSSRRGNLDHSSNNNLNLDETIHNLADSNTSSKLRRASSSSRRKEGISRNSSRGSVQKSEIGTIDYSSNSDLNVDESQNETTSNNAQHNIKRTPSATKRLAFSRSSSTRNSIQKNAIDQIDHSMNSDEQNETFSPKAAHPKRTMSLNREGIAKSSSRRELQEKFDSEIVGIIPRRSINQTPKLVRQRSLQDISW